MKAMSVVILASLLLIGTAGVLACRMGVPSPPAPSNVVPLTVRTPHRGFNRLVVSVTVCVPGTEGCATIPDVMVDTGSTGLRLEASAVPSTLRFPDFLGSNGRPLAECLRFVHDDAWGMLHRADLRIGGMIAPDLPIQIIEDGDRHVQPETCPRSTVHPTSNGTLGIGPQLTDCAGRCEQSAARPGVYSCGSDGCLPFEGAVAPIDRLPNPVTRFPVHNNGIVIDLPAAPQGGAVEVSGTLTFGVGTAGNNQFTASSTVRLDGTSRFTTKFRGRAFPDSYIDSGTETYVLADPGLPRCDGMDWAYCAVPDRRLSADMIGRDGPAVTMPFTVGDYRSFSDRGFGASDSIAAVADVGSTAFVWGAPFFIGKRIAVVVDGMAVPGAAGRAGPLYAIEPSRL